MTQIHVFTEIVPQWKLPLSFSVCVMKNLLECFAKQDWIHVQATHVSTGYVLTLILRFLACVMMGITVRFVILKSIPAVTIPVNMAHAKWPMPPDFDVTALRVFKVKLVINR